MNITDVTLSDTSQADAQHILHGSIYTKFSANLSSAVRTEDDHYPEDRD